MGGDEVVLGLDEAEEAAGELGLDGAAEGAEGEALAGGAGRGAALVGADGECSVPGGGLLVLSHLYV